MDEVWKHPWVRQGGPPSFARASQTEDVAASEAANELTFSGDANTLSERIGSAGEPWQRLHPTTFVQCQLPQTPAYCRASL